VGAGKPGLVFMWRSPKRASENAAPARAQRARAAREAFEMTLWPVRKSLDQRKAKETRRKDHDLREH
jgi:hypothetical protein